MQVRGEIKRRGIKCKRNRNGNVRHRVENVVTVQIIRFPSRTKMDGVSIIQIKAASWERSVLPRVGLICVWMLRRIRKDIFDMPAIKFPEPLDLGYNPTITGNYYNDFLECREGKTSGHDFDTGETMKTYFGRKAMVRIYSFAVLDKKSIEEMIMFSVYLLSLGCGSGYNEMLLRDAGADIVVTDNREDKEYKKEWIPIEKLNHKQAMEKYPRRDIFMCWPYMSDWTEEVVRNMVAGQKIIYVGEGCGGCTATNEFHQVLCDEFETVKDIDIPQWFGVHDYVVLAVKK